MLKKIIIRLTLLALVGAGAWRGYLFFQQLPQRQQQVATTRVRQGDVVVRSYARGELRAVRSATLTAPNLFGTVQVTRMASLGAFAKEKDLVVEFDDAEVRSRLEEKELEIEQIDEQFKKSQADLDIRNNQDQVDLLRARYAVRRAELEVKRNELLSAIDAKKNLLTLEEARRRLTQLESDIKSRLEQAEAELAVLRERKQKSLLEMAREKQRLNQVKLLAPMSGLVAIKQNSSSHFGFGFQAPDIREGDQVQPGMPIADVLDLSELEIMARVGELDRANLSEDQEVKISLDAIPDKMFAGKIKSMSSSASANVFSSDPAKKFDVTFTIDMKELLTTLGAKPEQIQRVLETAEQNRKKPPIQSYSPMMMAGFGGAGGAGGAGGGGMAMMAGGGPPMGGGMPGGGGAPGGGAGFGDAGGQGQSRGGGQEGGGGQRRSTFTAPGGGGQGGGGQMSEEDRTKFRAALQKALNGKNIQDLSQEERQKVMAQVMQQFRGQRPESKKSEGAKPESATAGGQPGGPGGGEGQQAAGGPERAREGGRQRGGGGGEMPVFAFGTGTQFTEKDLENAKLPPAPEEEDSQLEILLRPGLLADVQIIVEKIPNAIYIPAQALFEKDGKLIVFVKTGDRYEERIVKPSKRSESTLIVSAGLKAGEVVALSDPFAKKGGKKKEEKSSGGGGPMNSMPGRAGAGGM